MYSLADFIPYDGKVINGEHKVLVWSKQTGYYFTQMGFVVDQLIVAKENK